MRTIWWRTSGALQFVIQFQASVSLRCVYLPAAVWPWHLVQVPAAALRLTATSGGLALFYQTFPIHLYAIIAWHFISSLALRPKSHQTEIYKQIIPKQTTSISWYHSLPVFLISFASTWNYPPLPPPELQSPVICGLRGCCDEWPLAPVSEGGPQDKSSCLGSWCFPHCQRCQGASFLGSPYDSCWWTPCGGCWDRLQLVAECQPLWLGCGCPCHPDDVGLQLHRTVTLLCGEGSDQTNGQTGKLLSSTQENF